MTTNSAYQRFVVPKGAMVNKEAFAPTPSDIEGPFWLADAPICTDSLLDDGEASDLTVSGVVMGTHGAPIPGAVLDVWQCDKTGTYDLTGYKLRGKFRCDADGKYSFKTIVPGSYKISDPGQPDDFRCEHVHVKVSAPGFKTLTTQLYFSDDPYDKTDHWFDARRVIAHPEGFFQFVIERAE